MSKPVLFRCIVAHDQELGIGLRGTIPWRLPADLRHFRERTAGAAVIMGRRTWESIPARYRPLQGRCNVVVTRRASIDGACTVRSLDEALTHAQGRQVWVIGGEALYAEAIRRPECRGIDVTLVSGRYGCDARMPMYGGSFWRSGHGAWQTDGEIRYRFERWDPGTPWPQV